MTCLGGPSKPNPNHGSSRRRPRPTWLWHEESMLQQRQSPSDHLPNYSTFKSSDQSDEKLPIPVSISPFSYQCWTRSWNPVMCQQPLKSRESMTFSWKVMVGMSFCLCFLAHQLHIHPFMVSELQWDWDHNVYAPLKPSTGEIELPSSPGLQSRRNLLLAQVAGSPSLDQLVDISSRPNRAYARQWGRDYAKVSRQSSLISRTCFDKAVILRTALDKSSLRIPYDAIVVLPPDAIVTDLDFDLLHLIPTDRLVAIAGWDPSSGILQSHNEVLLFNLRHPDALAVSQLWLELIYPNEVTCGAGNDVELLLAAIEVASDFSTIIGLNETDRGPTATIKEMTSAVPTSKAVMLLSNMLHSKQTLQTTADAVCYRFYPKCEVL